MKKKNHACPVCINHFLVCELAIVRELRVVVFSLMVTRLSTYSINWVLTSWRVHCHLRAKRSPTSENAKQAYWRLASTVLALDQKARKTEKGWQSLPTLKQKGS